jgi:hypothetical protein
MRNVVPARALARRSRNLLFAAGFLFLLAILSFAFHVFLLTVPLVVPSNPNYDLYLTARSSLIWLGAVLVVVSLALLIRALTWKHDNPLAHATGELLGEFLDDRYAYIRNLSRFAIGYIDAVLVGPPGVLVLRITEKTGIFYNEGANWMQQQDKGSWKTLRWSPTREVVEDVRKLRAFLQARGMPDVPVFGAVVFLENKPITTVTMEQPVVPVLQPFELSYGLEDTYFARKDRLDQLTANKIATLLYG